jgi:hypothetical protein
MGAVSSARRRLDVEATRVPAQFGQLVRAVRASSVVVLLLLLPVSSATAQETALRFVAGAAVGFGLHEAGHLAAGLAFDASPGVKSVRFGPVPFFAITHDAVSPAREFTISSAGFWAQQLASEILLQRRPRLREEEAPLLKGILAFHLAASAVYAGAAFLEIGPHERDTRGMAVSARVPEPVVGALVLAPAVLDALRYAFPDRAWLQWMGRGVKVGGVLLVIRAAHEP